jgi:hypothetical protein
MRKPWSISTTVRNPERLRDFLRVLKELEGEPFNEDNQITYQVLLIQERLYKPKNIPLKFRNYYEHPETPMPYDVAKEILEFQNYEDPPMRGRQSVNPLNKLGFSIAREGIGPIKITELGNTFLAGDYDIGYVFFKSLLKLQFPNLWSEDFSEKNGFNIMPFIGVMHLINGVNKKSKKKGLDQTEFSIFIPTFTNFNQIDEQIEKILEFRKEEDKERYIKEFAMDFYRMKSVPDKKINNLYDYGDNIMRYFRLTRYFKVSMNPLGSHWNVDLEPSRKVEIEELLGTYKGVALEFESSDEYLDYLSDISKPTLPWEKKENLEKVAQSLRDSALELMKNKSMQIGQDEQNVLLTDIHLLSNDQLQNHISLLRGINLKLKERIKKIELMSNLGLIEEMIRDFRDLKTLRKYKPEQFEKRITEALKIINDEIQIKPNYPVDDEGEPINHAPGNKPDIECYYQSFEAICEVTLNSSSLQWVQEGQPVMRHLRDFENQHKGDNVFCIFVAPKIHNDTYSTFWISVKHEYDGAPQKILPLTSEQFAVLLESLLALLKQKKRFTHRELYNLYSTIIIKTAGLSGYSEWTASIQETVKEWSERVQTL